MIVIDEGRAEVPFRGRSRTPRRVAAALLVLALVWGGARLVSYRHDRAPYSATAVGAHASVQLVGIDQAQAALDALAGPGRLGPPLTGSHGGEQVVVGQVTFRTPRPRATHGRYALFVLDKFNGSAPVTMMWGVGPSGDDNVGQGWDGAYNDAAHRYHWLSTLSSVHVADGWTDPGVAVMIPADTPSPVTFTAALQSGGSAVTDPARRVTIALVFLSDDGHPYWADRLLG